MTARKSPSSNGVELTLDAVTKMSTPAERVVRFCVDGALFSEHQRLEDELDRMRENDLGRRTRTGRLNQTEEVPAGQLALAKKITKLEAEMDKHSVDFVFQRIEQDAWDQLVAAHPPAEGNDEHKRMGINVDTFKAPAVQMSCISPKGMDTSSFEPWWKSLSSGQRDLLFFGGAWAVNRDAGEVPKSLSASSVIRRSEQRSSSATE